MIFMKVLVEIKVDKVEKIIVDENYVTLLNHKKKKKIGFKQK